MRVLMKDNRFRSYREGFIVGDGIIDMRPLVFAGLDDRHTTHDFARHTVRQYERVSDSSSKSSKLSTLQEGLSRVSVRLLQPLLLWLVVLSLFQHAYWAFTRLGLCLRQHRWVEAGRIVVFRHIAPHPSDLVCAGRTLVFDALCAAHYGM